MLLIFLPVYIEDTGICYFKIYILENTKSSKLAYGKLKKKSFLNLTLLFFKRWNII